MKFISQTLLIFSLILYCYKLPAQKVEEPFASDLTYEIIKPQYEAMMGMRGGTSYEILNILEKFEASKITSDQDFADLLKILYPPSSKIGIVLYVYNNGSLRRIFFEPGIVIEQKEISITEKALIDLSNNITNALGIKTISADRSPRLRGVVQINKNNEGPDLETVIKEATDILIPEKFDEQYEHLIIIPALNIGTIPFYLLKPYKDDTYLIDKCSFVIAPGIIDFISLRTKLLGLENVQNALKVSDFDWSWRTEFNYRSFTFENPLFVSNPTYPVSTKFFFPDLPGAEAEIKNTIPYAKDYILLEGSEATKASVMENIKKCDMAYFATHGLANEQYPMDSSFLVVSGEEDPFITARDIMDLRNIMPNDFPEMVILSACQTGLGKAMESGIAGMARSFLIAGSNHVIMSLWNVDDKATAYLMNRFSFYLQQPHKFLPSEPLRLAILDTKKKYPNPMQWASFSAFGITY